MNKKVNIIIRKLKLFFVHPCFYLEFSVCIFILAFIVMLDKGPYFILAFIVMLNAHMIVNFLILGCFILGKIIAVHAFLGVFFSFVNVLHLIVMTHIFFGIDHDFDQKIIAFK